MSDDPASVADALSNLLRQQSGAAYSSDQPSFAKRADDILVALTAAGWEVVPAGTTGKRAAAAHHPDPASVANALDRKADRVSDAHEVMTSCDLLRAAARLLRDHADTTNQLAAAEAQSLRLAEVGLRIQERADALLERADAAEARLSALTDAIGNPDQLRAIARFGLPKRSHTDSHAYLRKIALAAAVQPHDSTPPPSVCPTCDSDNPARRELTAPIDSGYSDCYCSDPWHQQ